MFGASLSPAAVFSDQGVLGTIVVIEAGVIVFLFKMLLTEKDKRIESAQKVRDTIAEPLLNIQRTAELIYDKIKVSKEAQ